MITVPENKRNVPSLFTCLDGSEVKTAEDWMNKRRPEILELMQREEYGFRPDMSDVQTTVKVVSEFQGPKILNGRALRKTVEVVSERKGRQFIFTFDVFIPLGKDHPVPAFVEICNRGIMDCEPSREHSSQFYPVETIISRGYACAAFRTQEVAPDYEEGFVTGFHRLFPEFVTDRPADAWGTLTIWAWAASRVMDYFETEPLIDEKRVAVVGHSRGGKTSVLCAALDQRFAMAVTSCSGCSGDAIARGKTGESIGQILYRFPFWFCKNYQKYIGHEQEMPFDQHFMLSLIAPRLLYTSTRSNDAWADPASEYESLVQASPVWELFGKKGIRQPTMSLPEEILHEGSVGHHHHTGEHNMDEYDWDKYMDFADRYM